MHNNLEHSRKLGIAEATLMTIAVLAECELEAANKDDLHYSVRDHARKMRNTFKEIAEIARQALAKTGHSTKVGG